MKNKPKRLWEFPKISRFITEGQLSWDKKKHFIYIFTVVFLLFVVFMLFDLRQKIEISHNLTLEKEQIVSDIGKWEKVVAKHKDYRDGYLELARLEYRTGDIGKAKEYLNKVFAIDPNSKEGREFEKILFSNY
jgi:tetratricopeptide (TPR) repeat protein